MLAFCAYLPPSASVPPLGEMTQETIRVLHLLRSLGIGGTERRVLRLGQGLDPELYEVHVLSLYAAEGQMLPWPAGRHIHFPITAGFQWRRLLALAAYMRAMRFDVVHSHNWATMFYGVVAARLARVPVVLHGEHGRNDVDRGGVPWKRDMLAALLARLATRVVAVNESISADIRGRWRLDEDDVICLPNGVDLRRFAPATEMKDVGSEFVVGTVARLDGIKNLPCLLLAFEKLLELEPSRPMRLVVVGEGPLGGELRQLALRGPAAARIDFVGEAANPQDWYRRFDVYANTSFSEGMSNSILEAMACGVPVVASDIAGHRCWLRENENALFFPSDDARALAGCLHRLATEAGLTGRMGAANLELVRAKYDNKSFLERYATMYQELLGARGRRST